ncbi:MAG: hypothetical protein GF309_13490 [Candidatus Lokiarchaeota archaeon]|nr:hypothetical protein [Candidatus Lokiarchaeota archaeon]
MDSEVEEFVSRVGYLEPSYHTARVRSLLLKLDGKEVPCVTKIDLLTDDLVTEGEEIWPSKSMRIVEGRIAFEGIHELLDDIHSHSVDIGGVKIGYQPEEEPTWRYGVYYRGEKIGDEKYDTTMLKLRGTVDRRDFAQEEINELQNEIRLNPFRPFSSIRKLLTKFFGLSGDQISYNLIDIITPSNVKISSLTHVDREVRVRFECPREMVEDMQVKAILMRRDGGYHLYRPRLRNPSIKRLSHGFAEVTKIFQIPKRIGQTRSADLTLSLKGEVGLDTHYTHNLPLANRIWSVLNSFSESEFGKYFDLDLALDELKSANGKIFESIVSVLLTSCGLQVADLAGFPLSGMDLLAFHPRLQTSIICECTAAHPRKKLGRMKTVISDIEKKAPWLEFRAVVFTSQLVSEADRTDAESDRVTIRDASDIVSLMKTLKAPPDPDRVYDWLGIDYE